MSAACSTYEESRGVYRVLVGNVRQREHLEDRGVDGNIKEGSSVGGMWGMDWIDLVQDRERWWALVNAVMNLRFP